jgi:hypothetical protein
MSGEDEQKPRIYTGYYLHFYSEAYGRVWLRYQNKKSVFVGEFQRMSRENPRSFLRNPRLTPYTIFTHPLVLA